jgi:NADH-quinone oxidoreductase subunit E
VEGKVLSERSRAEIQRIGSEYPDPQSALLPALYLAQRDHGGWLPDNACDEVAAAMGLPPALVKAVASFYTMFHREPVGRHVVQVCTNISCSLMDAGHIVEHISQKLSIKPGETTSDGAFTLLTVECLGSCGTAPMMQIDDRYYEGLTPEGVDEILDALM